MASILEKIQSTRGAKTQIKQIWAEVNNEVATSAELSALNSTSKYSAWRLWTFLVACVSWLTEDLWKAKQEEIAALVEANVGYNELWLRNRLLEFQEGDALVLDELTGRPTYVVEDVVAQIVKFVAITTQNNAFYRAKLAGLDVDGNKVKLTTDQVNQVNDYLDALVLGNNGVAESLDPDLGWIVYTIYYSPLYLEVTTSPAVEAAINAYFNNLDFNGTYYETDFEAALKAVPGVVDLVKTSVQLKAAAGAYAEAGRKYSPAAGYINIDPLHPLVDTLTYVKES